MTRLKEWLLTPQRVAVHRPTATAVIADLHLGYHEARRQSGEAVPLPDMEETLAPLRALAGAIDVKRLVVAGDLFEKCYDPGLFDRFEHCLRDLALTLEAVVPGNHDRGLVAGIDRLPLFPDGFALGDWLVIHGHRPAPAERIVLGHVHPCVWHRGRRVPCFLSGPRLLMLPAFSADASGCNVWHDPLLRGLRCHAIDGDQVASLGPVPGRPPSGVSRRPWKGRLFRG